MRRALGLGFGEKIKIAGSRGSLFMRRSSGSADVSNNGTQPGTGTDSGSESEIEFESNKEKKLYFCFVERGLCGDEHHVNHVVRSIRLKLKSGDDDDDDDGLGGGDDDWLPVSAYKRSTGYTIASHLGSKIVFPTATESAPKQFTHLSCIDTSTPTKKFGSKLCSFSTPKRNPRLVGLKGKLYCFDTSYLENPELHPFEVLDPRVDLKWRPLPPPPFITAYKNRVDFHTSVLLGSNKIIGWQRLTIGVHCFDTTKPGNGWKELFYRASCTLPFINCHRPRIFVLDHHPFLGSFHLMFIHDPIDSLVIPFFMSDSYSTFRINKPLQLQLLDYDSFGDSDVDDDNPPPFFTESELVHLGDQKLCLVLNKFFTYGRHINTGFLRLVTFKYEIVTTILHSKPTVMIKTRLLGTRLFRYRSMKVRKKGPTETYRLEMTGAFLL